MTLRNIRLLIAFDGSVYSGWQRQINAVTIQGTIEEKLSVMTDSQATLHGAGRTDAGVHATGMVANFMTGSSIPCIGFLNGLNSMLPVDIRILKVENVDAEFHSRYSATGKTYSYRLFTGSIQLPTRRLYTAHFPGDFNAGAVTQALRTLEGTHDFSSFEAVGSRDVTREGRGAIRTLFKAALSKDGMENETWEFSFTGDGFLRHMVRNMVGTLLEVGLGKKTAEEFTAVLESRSREKAGPTAPACGLVLEHVHYKPLSPNL